MSFELMLVYTAAAAGDQPDMVQMVAPLIKRYGAQVYMCGHKHNLEVRFD